MAYKNKPPRVIVNSVTRLKTKDMTESEILEKYGKCKCEFDSSYKYTFHYVDVEGKFKIHGTAEYRGDFYKIMTVKEFWNEVSYFELELIKTKT